MEELLPGLVGREPVFLGGLFFLSVLILIPLCGVLSAAAPPRGHDGSDAKIPRITSIVFCWGRFLPLISVLPRVCTEYQVCMYVCTPYVFYILFLSSASYKNYYVPGSSCDNKS